MSPHITPILSRTIKNNKEKRGVELEFGLRKSKDKRGKERQ